MQRRSGSDRYDTRVGGQIMGGLINQTKEFTFYSDCSENSSKIFEQKF